MDTDHEFDFEEDMYNEYNSGTASLNVLDISTRYFSKNRLPNIDQSFKYGYFSKLTDGLVHCDGSGSHVQNSTKEQGWKDFSKKN